MSANFSAMSLSSLVVAYNEMAARLGESYVKRFTNRATALRRCQALYDRIPALEQSCAPIPEPSLEEKVSSVSHLVTPEGREVYEDMGVIAPSEPVAPAPAPEPVATSSRGRKSDLDLNSLLYMRVAANPKRKGSRSYNIFDLYGNAPITGNDYITRIMEAGYSRKLALDTIRWDLKHGFVSYEQ